ncbi:MFS transporter [Streptomyces sp. NPDC001732]
MTTTSGSRLHRRIAVATLTGTALEYYDLFVYAAMAALVFRTQFFPSHDPATSTLTSFATLAVGYFARPIGGIVLSHIGDRFGRKPALLLSLMLAGGSTTLIGVLPTYGSIGLAAPILLTVLRLVQGFGIGGEWGGSATLALEHAPADRRGLWTSWTGAGLTLGAVIATGVIAFITSVMSADAFTAWGWRIPFLLSAVIIVVGAVLRHRLEESPEYRALRAEQRPATVVEKLPLAIVLSRHWRPLLLCVMLPAATFVSAGVLNTWGTTYTTTDLGMSQSTVLAMQAIANCVATIAIPCFGYLSDRTDRARLVAIGAGTALVLVTPAFFLLRTGVPVLYLLAQLMITIPLMFLTVSQQALLPESFPTEVRYSAVSLAFQLTAVLLGGFTPLLAAALHSVGGLFAVGVLLAVACASTLVSALVMSRTRRPARQLLGAPQVVAGGITE